MMSALRPIHFTRYKHCRLLDHHSVTFQKASNGALSPALQNKAVGRKMRVVILFQVCVSVCKEKNYNIQTYFHVDVLWSLR
jgi:hypothetical protein